MAVCIANATVNLTAEPVELLQAIAHLRDCVAERQEQGTLDDPVLVELVETVVAYSKAMADSLTVKVIECR